MPSPRPRFTAALLAAFLAAPPAFSAEPARETTVPLLAPTTVVTPLRSPEAATGEAKAAPPGPRPAAHVRAEAERSPGPSAPHLAVFLPLESDTLGPLAAALRQGLIAAADAAGREGLPVRVHALAEDRVPEQDCARARADKAVLVMGGITRSGAAALAASACAGKPTLALNDPGDGPMPPLLAALSLSAEAEARQAAALALADGWRSVAVLMGPSPLDRRLADAFERDWAGAGGEALRLPFSGNVEEAPALRERLAKVTVEAVFLALDAEAARAARPYLSGSLAIYASSHGVDARAEASVNVDLEGVRYVDMPWFVQPDHLAVMAYPAPLSSLSPEQERLYALGIDAYRVGLLVARGEGAEPVVDGVTGALRIGQDRRVVRTLVPARVDAGRVVPLKPPR